MVVTLWNKSNKTVGIEHIVFDDDSTMRAHLQHPCNKKIGKLHDDIPEPSFLADPSHRIKVMCKETSLLDTIPIHLLLNPFSRGTTGGGYKTVILKL